MLLSGNLLTEVEALTRARAPVIVIVVHEDEDRHQKVTQPIHNNQRAVIRRARENPNAIFFPIAYMPRRGFNKAIKKEMPEDRTFDQLFHGYYLFSRGQINPRQIVQLEDRFVDYDAKTHQVVAATQVMNVVLMGLYTDACVREQLGHLHSYATMHSFDLNVYSARQVLHWDDSEDMSKYPEWLDGMDYTLAYRRGNVYPGHIRRPEPKDRYEHVPSVQIRFYEEL